MITNIQQRFGGQDNGYQHPIGVYPDRSDETTHAVQMLRDALKGVRVNSLPRLDPQAPAPRAEHGEDHLRQRGPFRQRF